MNQLILLVALLIFSLNSFADPSSARKALQDALQTEDAGEQLKKVLGFVGNSDPVVQQTLTLWRQGSVYLTEEGERKTFFTLDTQSDSDGKAKGINLLDGSILSDTNGKPALFLASDLTAVDTNAKLRKAIKTTLDLFAIGSPEMKVRRDAVIKLGQEQQLEYIPHFRSRLSVESQKEVQKALREAIAITQLASEDLRERNAAIEELERMRSINGLPFLASIEKLAKSTPSKLPPETGLAAHRATVAIEGYMWWGNLFGTAFRGLSLSSVLLVAALGLAITFGLMGIINMAHGELMMVGAYTAYVCQGVFRSKFGASGAGFDAYFIAALVASFVVAGLVGLALERSVIRFLYKRPLESLLATWGVSLILQQVFRHIFGAANVQVSSPSWLSGTFVINDVLLAYNRIFVIAFAVFTVLATYLLLTRTSFGLQMRAVMQNRAMASCLGVPTDKINMLTFALGSGLAGTAGACLSQIGNVGPSLGQNYIVDCFMVVVLGGVGNLVGTISAATGVGVTDQILQPWLGAVMGKITVLVGIILFLQWRPAGLFPARTRNLEG